MSNNGGSCANSVDASLPTSSVPVFLKAGEALIVDDGEASGCDAPATSDDETDIKCGNAVKAVEHKKLLPAMELDKLALSCNPNSAGESSAGKARMNEM